MFQSLLTTVIPPRQATLKLLSTSHLTTKAVFKILYKTGVQQKQNFVFSSQMINIWFKLIWFDIY